MKRVSLSLFSYIGYFLVVVHFITMMSNHLDVYWIYNIFSNPIIYYLIMAAPFILLVGHAVGGILDDADGLRPKYAIILALISSIVLIYIQCHVRIEYNCYNFFMGLNNIPNIKLIKNDSLYVTLWNLRMISLGVLGYAIYSFFISGASYEYVTITTYFTDKGFAYDEQVSGTKHAIWTHILLGVGTVLVSFIFSITPLVLLIPIGFIVLLFKHNSKKGLIIKLSVIGALLVLTSSPCLVYESGFSIDNFTTFKYFYHYDKNGQFDGLSISGNKTNKEHLRIPATYFGIEVVEIDTAAFNISNAKKLDSVIIPTTIKNIQRYAFHGDIDYLYYEGTYAMWRENNLPDLAGLYYYMEEEPSREGRYWHYDIDGKTPILWEF